MALSTSEQNAETVAEPTDAIFESTTKWVTSDRIRNTYEAVADSQMGSSLPLHLCREIAEYAAPDEPAIGDRVQMAARHWHRNLYVHKIGVVQTVGLGDGVDRDSNTVYVGVKTHFIQYLQLIELMRIDIQEIKQSPNRQRDIQERIETTKMLREIKALEKRRKSGVQLNGDEIAMIDRKDDLKKRLKTLKVVLKSQQRIADRERPIAWRQWPRDTGSSDMRMIREGAGPIPTSQCAVDIEYTGYLGLGVSGKPFIERRQVIQLGQSQDYERDIYGYRLVQKVPVDFLQPQKLVFREV